MAAKTANENAAGEDRKVKPAAVKARQRKPEKPAAGEDRKRQAAKARRTKAEGGELGELRIGEPVLDPIGDVS